MKMLIFREIDLSVHRKKVIIHWNRIKCLLTISQCIFMAIQMNSIEFRLIRKNKSSKTTASVEFHSFGEWIRMYFGLGSMETTFQRHTKHHMTMNSVIQWSSLFIFNLEIQRIFCVDYFLEYSWTVATKRTSIFYCYSLSPSPARFL